MITITSQISEKSDIPILTKLMLFHDGSMTRFMTLLNNEEIIIDLLNESDDLNQKFLADYSKYIKGEICREVLIKTKTNKQLIFARSIWTKEIYQKIMGNKKNQPIGANLTQTKQTQFREIIGAFEGKPEDKLLQYTQVPIKARAYVVYGKEGVIFYCEEYFIN